MAKKETHVGFIGKIKDRPFVALTEYKKSKVKVLFQCNIDGHIWDAAPSDILRGGGCPKCAGHCGNDIISDDGVTLEVDVSTKTHKDAIMLIDKADYLSIRETHNGRILADQGVSSCVKYAGINIGSKFIKLHRLIIDGNIIDHKNRNGLDNRRSNLRSCTHSENNMNIKVRKNNSTGITGVTINKRSGRYVAQICVNCQYKYLGTFSTIEEAAKSRVEAELKYFGEFTPVNTGENK